MKKFIAIALILFVSFGVFAARQSSVSINGGYTYTHQNIYIDSDSTVGSMLIDGKQSSELAYSYHVAVKADTFFDSGLGFEASAALDKYFRYNYMTSPSEWEMKMSKTAYSDVTNFDTHTELWNGDLDEFGWITTVAFGPAYKFVVTDRFQGQMALMAFWTHSTQDSGSDNSKALGLPVDRTDDYFGAIYELSGKYFVSDRMFINFGITGSAAFLWNIHMKLTTPLGDIDEDIKAKDYDAHRYTATPFLGVGITF